MEIYATLIPVLVGLGEILKRVFGVESKLIPIAIPVLGLSLAFIVGGVNSISVMEGLISALMAMGIYSSGKSLAVGARALVNKKKK